MKKNNNLQTYRVLHIFSGYGGGISSLILNLLENKTHNFTFDIMAFSYKGGEVFLDRIHKTGSACYLMPRPRIDGWEKFHDYIEHVFLEHTYDAVHCHIDGWRAMPFWVTSKLHHIHTFIIHAHKTRYESRLDMLPIMRYINQKINNKIASNYMTCSQLAADFTFGIKYLAQSKSVLIPNGINVGAFRQPLTIEQSWTYDSEFNITREGKIFIFAHVGRFTYQKNHGFILNIIKLLKKQCIPFVFLLIGDGELFESVYSKAREMGINDCIRYLGHRQDVPQLMKYANVVILPSHWEGLPTVAIECQATGTPILLADTITKECDMNLGLAKFLPISDASIWISEMINVAKRTKVETEQCISAIQDIGFTSASAGKIYCDTLEKIISSCKKG